MTATDKAKKEKLSDGTWLAVDADGTEWICKREPFYNGAIWFVKLEKWDENLEDFMQKKLTDPETDEKLSQTML